MFNKIFLVLVFIVFLGLVLFGSRLNVPSWAYITLFLMVCPLSMALMHGEHDHDSKENKSNKKDRHVH